MGKGKTAKIAIKREASVALVDRNGRPFALGERRFPRSLFSALAPLLLAPVERKRVIKAEESSPVGDRKGGHQRRAAVGRGRLICRRANHVGNPTVLPAHSLCVEFVNG